MLQVTIFPCIAHLFVDADYPFNNATGHYFPPTLFIYLLFVYVIWNWSSRVGRAVSPQSLEASMLCKPEIHVLGYGILAISKDRINVLDGYYSISKYKIDVQDSY